MPYKMNKRDSLNKPKRTIPAQVQPVVRQDGLYFIIAGSKSQADFLARMENIPPEKLRYISSPQHLRGIDGNGKTLHTYGTWYRLPNFDEILEIATSRGWRIISV